MLALLCLAVFLSTGTGIGLAPFLLSIARDLDTDLAAVANLVALMSVPWGAISLFAGVLSDRIGRRPILVGGLALLGLAQLALSQGASYPQLAAAAIIAGLGGGCAMGTVFATASDSVPSSYRGRALGWVMTGQSLSMVIGVPVVTLLGSFIGWRGAIMFQAVALVITSLGVWLVVPGGRPHARRPGSGRASIRSLLRADLVALLSAGTAERLCFASYGVYFATYLIASYGISLRELALGLALVASGNFFGNVLGGQITDRIRARQLFFGGTLVASGLLALPLFLWQPSLIVALLLGFCYSMAVAMGRPALLSALSAVPTELRGTMLGTNVTFNSLGWLGATALGGQLIANQGFSALGLLVAASGLVGGGLAAASWLFSRRSTGR